MAKPLHLCNFKPLHLLIKNKTYNLAPIEVEILLCRPDSYREAQKIETDSGTGRLLKTKISASKKKP
ncbi:hypothetical protein D0817_15910 [Flavobacterium cupreum]|uniref:Uncharacterized protein n=1 Tax=Flavobacterium cupreum TaxID=2133766 RepID=A0A434A4L3_9FLAO|nr:hypothetical protein D0817_15910 [Flavobacterium cupreum]